MADTGAANGTGNDQGALPEWWNEKLENPPGFVMTKLQKERWRIQSQLELRYSLLEAAVRRLTTSIGRTGLPANAGSDADKGIIEKVFKKSLGGKSTDSADAGLAMPPISTWQLATIDVFVEKAQDLLIARSNKQYVLAYLCSGLTILALGAGVWFVIAYLEPNDMFSEKWGPILSRFLAHIIPLGLFLAIVYFMASLARAFFHEATILENRRHSVRLGRLLLHLKVSSARSPQHLADIIAGLNLTDLDRIFGWNLETSTAFKDIRPEAMTNIITGEILSKVEKLSEAVASVKKPG